MQEYRKKNSSGEYQFSRAGRLRPVVSTAAPDGLRKIILSKTQGGEVALAKAAVEFQLQSWEKTLKEVRAADAGLGAPFGVDLDALKFSGELGENSLKDIEVITKATKAASMTMPQTKDIWSWETLPYVVRCGGLAGVKEDQKRPQKKSRSENNDRVVPDVDEWILRNELYLRLLSRKANVGTPTKSWTFGLTSIKDLPTVIPGALPISGPKKTSAPCALKIPRVLSSSPPGFSILDNKRASAVFLQPSIDAFKSRWDAMTESLLSGLNWDNVFVAGGLVLGVLLTPEVPSSHPDYKLVNKPDEWKSSDIDLYIYGLSPEDANAKIKHIADTYKANLPKGAPFLVVRNSQTITLYSEWPRRRVQIVLKLIGSPREVLLNFDLDICAAGYDGKEAWLLPRCVRALETGTNIFTMDLINGHYLGERKASRDKRVFKYADKGFGLRILPSYMASLSTYNAREQLDKIARGEVLPDGLALPVIAERSRQWTQKVVNDYGRLRKKNSPFHWPRPYPVVKSDKPVLSHAMLESYCQVSAEPLGRSCLTGFELLMRHVALWEQEVAGKIEIFQDLFASDTYGEGLQNVAYDDSPSYPWDDSFAIDGFKKALDKFNKKENEPVKSVCKSPFKAARITYADNIEQALSAEKDIIIPLWVPEEFSQFANDIILKALTEHDQPSHAPPLKVEVNGKDTDVYGEMGADLTRWTLDMVLNWQMLDRRIDEVREMLWAFHRANERPGTCPRDYRFEFLMTSISKRAVRTTVEDEMEAFVRWVGREPYLLNTKLPAIFQLLEDRGKNTPSGLYPGDREEEADEDDDDDDGELNLFESGSEEEMHGGDDGNDSDDDDD